MKSPFPGMDPYIETHGFWGDFRNDLIFAIKNTLTTVLPGKYRVRTAIREVIELVEAESRVAVAETIIGNEPMALRAFVAEEFRESFVEIHTVEPERRLVTCIEVLSPSNKRPHSAGREQYLRKRQALLLGEANLVEIDLLRGGDRMPMLDPWPNSPYHLLVGRWYKEAVCHVWPAHYRKTLPPFPVPLDRPDSDLILDLQPMIDGIYDRSRYGMDIDYTRPLDPPLGEADHVWLQEQLKTR